MSIVKRSTAASVSGLLESYRSMGFRVRRAVLVVGSVIEPSKIANQHIRAHALEGRLFRTVLEKSLRSRRVAVATVVERNLISKASARLRRPASSLTRTLANLRPSRKDAWRAEQKMAALAAWISL